MPLAKSWLYPLEVEIKPQVGVTNLGFDSTQYAYVLEFHQPQQSNGLELTLAASPERPAVHPAFLIQNWVEKPLQLCLDGAAITDGKQYRIAWIHRLEGDDAIIWFMIEFEKETVIAISAL